ncbi:uncharacterized protein ARMOST_14179 [Armillaria ostoyae]|uniref:Uncharacterized protein n=1 Tax=Armillaria ostoyae TaxID=47428 RepID=A0A284RQ19_ARMOS|nr:uncharacterized protein ARMOST_14179 [Armillaria ostoyae]
MIKLLKKHKEDAFVVLDELLADLSEEKIEQEVPEEDVETAFIARCIARSLWNTIGFRFIYKTRRLEGQETKQRLVEDPAKRRATMKMDRLNDEAGTKLTADEIHRGAVRDMYEHCFRHNLSQVWAYMWNRWYTPKQWVLWARSACDTIPRLKTTMVVESLWRQMKHRDLPQFNRPRLDLVTHVVLKFLLPRIKRTMDYLRGWRRIGRPQSLASWQESFKKDWHDMGKPDEQRLIKKELDYLKNTSMKPKIRAERLAKIRAEETRPRGPFPLVQASRVREPNKKTSNAPLHNLRFFLDLRRNHYPPYYSIPGIHRDTAGEDVENVETTEVHMLLLGRSRRQAHSRQVSTSSTFSFPITEDSENEGTPTKEKDTEIDTEQDEGDDEAEQEDPERIFFGEAEIQHLERCYDDMMGVATSKRGVHPKMTRALRKVFDVITEVGSDIGKEKRRRTMPRTWKDSTPNTLYLD